MAACLDPVLTRFRVALDAAALIADATRSVARVAEGLAEPPSAG